MAWFQQQQFNLGEVSPGAANKTATPASIAGLLELRNGAVRYDNTVAKRMGSRDVNVGRLDEEGVVRAFPIGYRDDEYFLILTSLDTVPLEADGVRQVRLYKKQGSWNDLASNVPLPCWDTNSIVYPPSWGYTGQFFDRVAHPYREDELPDVRQVSYRKYQVLLHENYEPLVFYRADYAHGFLNVDEAWNYEFDFFDQHAEVGTEYRNPLVFSFSSRQGSSFARVTLTAPAFEGARGPEYESPTATSPSRLGDIYRLGKSTGTTDKRKGLYGQYWAVDHVVGSSTCDMQVIPQTDYTPDSQASVTINTDDLLDDSTGLHDWAGPWRDVGALGATVVPGSFSLPQGGLKTHEVGVFTLDNPPIEPGKADDMCGEIWATTTLGTALLVVRAGPDSATRAEVTAVNIGPNKADYSTLDFSTLRRMLPQNPMAMWRVVNNNAGTAGEVTYHYLRFVGNTPGLPPEHEKVFRNSFVNRIETGSNSDASGDQELVPCGGAVFLNDGKFVVEDAGDLPWATNKVQYWVRIEEEPSSLAPTCSWGYGWSKATGFPSVGTVHQQRLVLSGFKEPGGLFLASSPNKPQSLNSTAGFDLLDAPLSIEITGTGPNERVRWMVSANRHLQFGTNFGEYSLRGVPLSSGSIGLEPHSKYGAGLAIGAATSVGPATAFVTQGGVAVREMQVEQDTGQFVSPNILALADHLLATGERYVEIVGVRGREPFYALRTNLGALVMLSRDIEQEILAPSKMDYYSTGKRCLQIFSAPGIEAGADEALWGLFAYTAESGEFSTALHCFTPGVYMDGQTVIAAGLYSANEVQLPRWMRGRTVQLVRAGAKIGDFEVPDVLDPSILVSLPDTSEDLLVGEKYTFIATPSTKDSSYRDGSSTAGQIKQINNLRVYVVESVGGSVVEDNTSQILPAYIDGATAPTPYTGWVDVPGVGVNGREPRVAVHSGDPFPFRISTICMEMSMK